MWNLTEGRITNLFSHKFTVFKVVQGRLTVLLAENKTEAGADSNGGGKSSIIEGITLAVSGDVYRGVTKDEFIRRGTESAITSVRFENSILNRTMFIERRFFLKKSSEVVILIDDEVVFDSKKDRTKKNDPDAIIFDQLGFTKDDFLNYFVIGQGNTNNFFTTGDATQKAIISRFANFDKIDRLLAILKDEIDELSDQINEKQLEISTVEGQIATTEENINEIQEIFQQEQEEELEAVKLRIEKNDTALAFAKEEVQETNNKIVGQEHMADVHKSKMIDNIGEQNKKLITINQKINEIDKNVRENQKLLGRLANLQGQSIKCPECDKEFIPDSELSVKEVEDSINQVNEAIQFDAEEREGLCVDMNAVETAINNHDEQKRLYDICTRNIKSYKQFLSEQEVEVERLKKRKLELVKESGEIKSKTVDDKISK